MDDLLKEPPATDFKSVDDECAYWKQRCDDLRHKLIETKQEYVEFMASSQDLETELETSLEQREKTIRDLKHSLNQIQTDNESLRKKITTFETDYTKLDNSYTQLNSEFEQLREHTRKLEQNNDDLERANRVVSATVSDLEQMLNQAYEKNEFLELEVEDKESLSVKHQRVLDELRDLKQEMNVKTTPHNTSEKQPPHSDNILNGNAPPIASQKAFNIIADSLRRIDIMAAKLKACQEIMPPSNVQQHQQQQQQQQQRRRSYLSSSMQSASLKSLNGTLNASRLSVTNDLDESSVPADSLIRNTTAI